MMGLSLARESAAGKLGHLAPPDLFIASRQILSVDDAGLEGHVVLRLARLMRIVVISWSSNCHGIVGFGELLTVERFHVPGLRNRKAVTSLRPMSFLYAFRPMPRR
jgi:hypothetical protein